MAKKILLTVAAVILIVATLGGIMTVSSVTNFTSYGSSATVDEDARKISCDNDRIKILHLSDLQTTILIESARAYSSVKRLVEKTEPDLIVLTGDNISNGSSKLILSTFISFFDSLEIPWALVFGNHDRNSSVPMEEICAELEESEYCIFKTGYLDDRYGNYYYNIELQGETVRSLIFMDSAKTNFTEEQVAWYKQTVTKITEAEERVIPSFVFCHIPIQELSDAAKAYEADPLIGTGSFRDEPRTQSENTGFFAAAKELGSTDGIFYGHDHRNNAIIKYEGVTFCYALKTSNTVYYDLDRMGGNLITVTKNGFTIDRIFDFPIGPN